MTDEAEDAPLAPIEAHWLTSTGSGDDVLEVTIRVTAAQLSGVSDAHLLVAFGSAAAAVGERLNLYRLAHMPGVAQASEAEVLATYRKLHPR